MHGLTEKLSIENEHAESNYSKPTDNAILLGIDKVAQATDVSVRTVWSWILEKKLPTIHIGRRRLVRLSDLRSLHPGPPEVIAPKSPPREFKAAS